MLSSLWVRIYLDFTHCLSKDWWNPLSGSLKCLFASMYVRVYTCVYIHSAWFQWFQHLEQFRPLSTSASSHQYQRECNVTSWTDWGSEKKKINSEISFRGFQWPLQSLNILVHASNKSLLYKLFHFNVVITWSLVISSALFNFFPMVQDAEDLTDPLL